MTLDALKIFRVGAVNVPGYIEVVFILLYLIKSDRPGVFRYFKLFVEDVNDLVDVPFAKAVLRTVFHEAFACIYHEDAFS